MHFIYILIVSIFVLVVSILGCQNENRNNDNKNLNWSFAVLADPLADGKTFQHALREIRDMADYQDPEFKRPEFILAVGDLAPIELRYAEYLDIFSDVAWLKSFFPVMGNHDVYDEPNPDFMVGNIIPEQKHVVARDNIYANYTVQWKNVMLINVDTYSDLGEDGCINEYGLLWVKENIESAPNSIDHIFISFHEPAFPRYRHLDDSFNACENQRNAFWKMIVNYRDSVKGVFVGHTHYYYKMRVFDPESECANDTECFPNDINGIYQIDVGASGRGERNTIVLVQISGNDISFRVKDTEDGQENVFEIIDEWELTDDSKYLSIDNYDISVPNDYPSIQSAIDASVDGQTIGVHPGIYFENINISDKKVKLSSIYNCGKDVECLERTIIDGRGETVLSLGNGSNGFTVKGFTIQNGADGISVRANVNIVDNYIRWNSDGIDYESGGGICLGNIIEDNSDDAIDLDGPTGVEIDDNILVKNDDDGIEVRLHSYSGSLLTISIQNNIIKENGEDGIQLIDYDGLSDRKFIIKRNLIANNVMAGIGCMGDGNTIEDYHGELIPEKIYVINNTITGNDYGITGGASLVAVNNIISDTNNIALKNVSVDSSASYNLFWNNVYDYVYSNIVIDTSLFGVDPHLESDYTLGCDSAAVDSGTNVYFYNGEDIIDYKRYEYYGKKPDLGWYEVIQNPVVCHHE